MLSRTPSKLRRDGVLAGAPIDEPGSVARRRYGDDYIIIAEAPRVERVGHSKRAKLAIPRASIAEPTRERIRQLAADGWSLRCIAAEVGVSHESVRKVLRSNPVDVMAAD